jgi:hypothetical protein
MKMRKSMGELAWLVVVSCLIIAALMIFRGVPWLQHFVGVKHNVDVVLELDDKSSKVSSLLNTRTHELDVLDVLASDIAGVGGDSRELGSLADQLEVTILVYKGGGTKNYGDPQRWGTVFPVDVPLPGGDVGGAGVVTYMDLDEEGFS